MCLWVVAQLPHKLKATFLTFLLILLAPFGAASFEKISKNVDYSKQYIISLMIFFVRSDFTNLLHFYADFRIFIVKEMISRIFCTFMQILQHCELFWLDPHISSTQLILRKKNLGKFHEKIREIGKNVFEKLLFVIINFIGLILILVLLN